MIDRHGKLVEGAAAVTVAGYIKQAEKLAGQTVVLVICGSNISSETLKMVLDDS